MNEIIEHLKLIQGVINRMSQISFILKGWTVSISIAILGFATSTSNYWVCLIALFPALVFWALDAYYLRQERLFRCLYDKVRNNESKIPAFSMDTSTCSNDVDIWRKTLWTKTIFWLHGLTVVLIMIVTILLYINGTRSIIDKGG